MARSGVLRVRSTRLNKLDQHVNEMMTKAGKKFQNFLWSRFLIIVQNVNMVTNGKHNSRLKPTATYPHSLETGQNSRLLGPCDNSARFETALLGFNT